MPSDPIDGGDAGDGNDMIIGGAGVENVRAGGGNDFVDVKAADDLACGLHRLLTDTALRLELGRKGREAVRERYTAEVMARNTAAVYGRYVR